MSNGVKYRTTVWYLYTSFLTSKSIIQDEVWVKFMVSLLSRNTDE